MLTTEGGVGDLRVISSDSHVDEPIDELIARLPEELRSTARRVVEVDGERLLHVPGLAPISLEYSERQLAGDMTDPREVEREFRADPTGGRDLARRIAAIESDGVWGEVIYPNRNLAMNAHPDPGYQREMARVHNDMLAEVFFEHRDRFAPAAMIPTALPADAATAVVGAKEMGFKCVMLPPVVPWLPYWHKEWEPLWSTLEESDLPANFHVFSGNAAQGVDFGNLWVISDELVAVGRRNFKAARTDEHLSTTAMGMAAGMSPLMHLIGSGVLDRHPGLRFAIVESEAGWLPWALQALDLMQRRRRYGMVELELRPSEYFHRQGWATFIEDKVAIDLIEYIGEDRLMWSNDWPHDEGTFHESIEVLHRLLGHLPERTQRKLLHDNAAFLYGLDSATARVDRPR